MVSLYLMSEILTMSIRYAYSTYHMYIQYTPGGWMPHRRETHMVSNLHFPTGTTYFRIWNIRAFLERTPYQFPGRMKNSPCPGQGTNQRPPAHPDNITNKESHTLLVRSYKGITTTKCQQHSGYSMVFI